MQQQRPRYQTIQPSLKYRSAINHYSTDLCEPTHGVQALCKLCSCSLCTLCVFQKHHNSCNQRLPTLNSIRIVPVINMRFSIPLFQEDYQHSHPPRIPFNQKIPQSVEDSLRPAGVPRHSTYNYWSPVSCT
jgi:hypothetical protein